MNYTDQLAEQVIQQYGLGRTARYRWEAAGEIPDIYFTDGFVKPKPFTEDQKKQQEAFIAIIIHPLILHSAFSDNVSFAGKLDEMISLRKGKKEKRAQRPTSAPSLKFFSR